MHILSCEKISLVKTLNSINYFTIRAFVINLSIPGSFCRRSRIVFFSNRSSRLVHNIFIIFIITISFDAMHKVIYFSLISLYDQLLALQNIKQLSSLRKYIVKAIDENMNVKSFNSANRMSA